LTEVAAPYLLSGLLTIAILGKGLRFSSFLASIEERVGSRRSATMLATSVLFLELSIAISVWTAARLPGAVLLIIFLVGASLWQVTGAAVQRDVVLPDCQCFGLRGSVTRREWTGMSALKPAWWALRNGGIAGLSIGIVFPSAGLQRSLAIGIAIVSFGTLTLMALAVRRLRQGLVSPEASLEHGEAMP
jgi:hypothetical protein